MTREPRPRSKRNAWGEISRLPSKRVRARYVGPDGQRYSAPHLFADIGTARAWLELQQHAIRDGRWTPEAATAQTEQRGLTLGQYAPKWFDTRLNRRGEPLRPRTRTEYERLIDGPLAALAPVPLRSLTAAKVTAWYRELSATGKTTQAARAYSLLSSITRSARLEQLMTENVCTLRGAGSATTGREVTPPTSVELGRIVDAITPRYRAAVLLAAWAGLRFGELTELRRKDLHVEREGRDVAGVVVHVTRAVTHTTGQGFIVGLPKSAAGVRAVVLPPHILPEIVAHLRDHVADFPESLLFPSADGVGHLGQSTFVKHWYPARAAAGRKDMPFHALRHYGATRYAQTGATLKEIQTRLGHSTVAAAMRYQHAAGRDDELARLMSELAHHETTRANAPKRKRTNTKGTTR